MGFDIVGTRTVDWDTKQAASWDVTNVEKEKGVVVFIRAEPLSSVYLQQYLNIIAVFDTDEGLIEAPLAAKFFAKGNWMAIAIGVPVFDYFDGAQLTVIATPQEFYPGRGGIRTAEVVLAWEDSETLESKSIPPFQGV